MFRSFRSLSSDNAQQARALDGDQTIVHCTECGKTWPSRFGAGAPTVRLIEK